MNKMQIDEGITLFDKEDGNFRFLSDHFQPQKQDDVIKTKQKTK